MYSEGKLYVCMFALRIAEYDTRDDNVISVGMLAPPTLA